MKLRSLHHIVVDYDKRFYCGHPRQCGMWNFGGGELAVMYRRAPCKYETENDVSHRPSDGYMSRSDIILRRSLDHGATWLPENDVIVWSNARPLAEKLAFLSQNPADRKTLDMRASGAMFFVGFTSVSVRDPKTQKLNRAAPGISGAFQLRSVDKGRTWEDVPLPLSSWGYPPVVELVDGTHAKTFGSGPVFLTISPDGGLTWQPPTMIARNELGGGGPSYAGLLPLPDGRLQCYVLTAGRHNVIGVCESQDGTTWTAPRPIVRYGRGPWAAQRPPANMYALRTAYGGWDQLYRSPWPLRLRDGRIVVFFARREYPPSIALIVSDDAGRTWSDPAIIRDDAEGSDMGYPVATELDDGRLFTAYYFQKHDGNHFGGSRFIGGSFVELG